MRSWRTVGALPTRFGLPECFQLNKKNGEANTRACCGRSARWPARRRRSRRNCVGPVPAARSGRSSERRGFTLSNSPTRADTFNRQCVPRLLGTARGLCGASGLGCWREPVTAAPTQKSSGTAKGPYHLAAPDMPSPVRSHSDRGTFCAKLRLADSRERRWTPQQSSQPPD